MDSSLMGGEQSKVIFDKYLIRLKSLILMNVSNNYTSKSYKPSRPTLRLRSEMSTSKPCTQ